MEVFPPARGSDECHILSLLDAETQPVEDEHIPLVGNF